jgi:hypothetical protein
MALQAWGTSPAGNRLIVGAIGWKAMNTVLIIVALLLLGSAIWGWRRNPKH